MDNYNPIRSLIPLLIKCYEHSHPLTFLTFVDSEFGHMDRLDIFKMASSSNESIRNVSFENDYNSKGFCLI